MSSNPSFLFYNDHQGTPLFLQNPVQRISANHYVEVLPTLQKIDALTKQNRYFLAGYISYEAGYPLLGIESKSEPVIPLIDFYVFERASEEVKTSSGQTAFYNFSIPESTNRYLSSLDKIRSHLTSGNTYQVNYTYQNMCRSYGDTKNLFLNLYKAQPSKYAVLAELQDFDILSVSPELFFSKVDNTIISKPMKGTLPLGENAISPELLEKLKSENMMIVDLIRNDLSKVAKPESVRVTQLMETEQYPTLQQIVSTIEGEVDVDVPFSSLITALFPCGSITGAPKLRTMEIIRDLEQNPRGIYTGTIGFITPDNDMQFNVAIRTLCGRGTWSYGVGGGIVLDSNVDDEYQEAILKSQFIRKANSGFYLFETLLAADAKTERLAAHIDRLKASAATFGFPWNEGKIKSAFEALDTNTQIPLRVKLKYFCDGDLEIETSEIHSTDGVKKVAVSSARVDSNDLFLKHKTSNRDFYDDAYLFSKARGYYDVIFLNERGELTEASRHNIFVRMGNKWFTPPLACGLLPGVARQRFLNTNDATEKNLSLLDIKNADEVVLTNSVRGAVTVEVDV